MHDEEEKKFNAPRYIYCSFTIRRLLLGARRGAQGLWKIKAYFWRKRAEGEFAVKEKALS